MWVHMVGEERAGIALGQPEGVYPFPRRMAVNNLADDPSRERDVRIGGDLPGPGVNPLILHGWIVDHHQVTLVDEPIVALSVPS